MSKKTRNYNTFTEAKYWGLIRSSLRKAFQFWRPAQEAKKLVRRKLLINGHVRWMYQCANCEDFFTDKETQVDHVEPLGPLSELRHLPEFVNRLTPESLGAFQCVCKGCHQLKTNAERRERKRIKSKQTDMFEGSMGSPYID
jgi:5-methylcytosine-specific restriction endonuclease McrA